MRVINSYIGVLHQYCVFRGRIRRRDYWGFVLMNSLIMSAIITINNALFNGSNILGVLYILAVFLPGLGALVRRLHDTGRSAWWLLLLFIPFVGVIVIIIFLCLDSQPERNDWGINPKERLFFSGK